jgi:hypothetical protein
MKTTKVEKFPMTHAEKDSPRTGAIPGNAYEGPHGIMFRLGAREGARPGPAHEALRLEAERARAEAIEAEAMKAAVAGAALPEEADLSNGA